MLLADAETLDQFAILTDVFFLEVIQEVPTGANELQKTTTGMMILLVSLEVFGKIGDSCGQKSDLDLGGTGVVFVFAVFGYELLLIFNC